MDGATSIELASGPYGHWIGELRGTRAWEHLRVPRQPLGTGVRTAAEPGQAPHGPYALAVTGELQVHDAIHPYRMDDPDVPDDTDSAPYVPHGVYARTLEPSPNRPPRIPWDRTVIYEMHVKGFTKLHRTCPRNCAAHTPVWPTRRWSTILAGLRGDQPGTAPVQHFVPEPMLLGSGLTNYWGTTRWATSPPHAGYAAHGQRGSRWPSSGTWSTPCTPRAWK